MTTKEIIHIAKNIGAIVIVDEKTANAVEKDIVICAAQGKYGIKAILFKATDGKYYYVDKPFCFIYKFIV